jgi:hypothetical protein
MTSSPQTLRGYLSQLQKAVAKFYSQLQLRFEGNVLVSGMWAAMGAELQSQVDNLKKIPPSFWQALKKQEKELIRAATLVIPAVSEGSLRSCLAQVLDIEEPIILRVYAPLIQRLRSDWTELALDFYILVKAHIARLAQSIQLFSGDPALSLRCALLLQTFEREVQEHAEIAGPLAMTHPQKATASKHAAETRKERAKSAVSKKPALSLAKIAKRAKPLVRKVKLSGRRAQR